MYSGQILVRGNSKLGLLEEDDRDNFILFDIRKLTEIDSTSLSQPSML